MSNSIEIPKTKEYGWILQDSGERVFMPTKKSFWNRIGYIVNKRGGKLIPGTMEFTIEGCDLSDDDLDMIKSELTHIGGFERPDDIELDDSGREQPNFDNDPLGSL